jgi:Tfp pilus assembly protein PilF
MVSQRRIAMNFDQWRHYLLARAFELAHQPERALSAYRDAHRSNPRFAKALNAIGFILASQGRFDSAEEHFSAALQVEPGNADVQFNLGFVLDKQGRHARAIEAFREAVNLKRSLDRAWYGMGHAHAALGQHGEAAVALQEAATLQPMNPHAWYALGMAYHHCRNPDKVKEIVEHLFRFDPKMTRRLIQDAGRSDLAYLVKDLLV